MQIASTVPPKGLFNLQGSDFLKGLGIALFGNITAIIIFLIRQDHWPAWVEWQPYIEVTVTTFLGYIGKNYFTNNSGQMFTSDKPIVHVDAVELQDLQDKAETKEIKHDTKKK